MVDGLGDGLVVECASEDTDYLRTTSFGLLQVGAGAGAEKVGPEGPSAWGAAAPPAWPAAPGTLADTRPLPVCPLHPTHQPPPGLPHAQHQDRVRVVPLLRPHPVQPPGAGGGWQGQGLGGCGRHRACTPAM